MDGGGLFPEQEGKETPFTVSEISEHIKSALEEQFASVWVEGELGKVSRPASGHLYLTLKDDGASLDAVMWRATASKLKFAPEQGMMVLVRGRVTTYAPYGKYQMVLDTMEPSGVGALQVRFEQLKKKLEAKGYFDQARKRPLPEYPRSIGVVTSGTGAAFRDIVKNIRHRNPSVAIVICPVLVEGAQSAPGIAEAIDLFNRYGKVDLLIVGRGGGSPESLWGFNEEVVADAIFRSKIPVISAVGHEVDFTISDFVADLRAPTPSTAAVLAVKDRGELLHRIGNQLARVSQRAVSLVRERRSRFDDVMSRGVMAEPARFLEPGRQRVDENVERLTNAARRNRVDISNRVVALRRQLESLRPDRILKLRREHFNGLEKRLSHGMRALADELRARMALATGKLAGVSPANAVRRKGERVSHLMDLLAMRGVEVVSHKREELQVRAGKLDMLSPLRVLERGYSITRKEGGAVVKRKSDVSAGEKIEVLLRRLEDGSDEKLDCRVI